MSKTKFFNKLLPPIIIATVTIVLIFVITFWFILRGTLYASAEDDFFEHGQMYSIVIEQYIDKLSSITFQLGSRSQMRNSLYEYHRMEIPLMDANQFIEPKLYDGVNATSDISSAKWLDINGDIIATVGHVEPEIDFSSLKTELETDSIQYLGPITINDSPHFRLATKIMANDLTHIGYNIVYFPTIKIEQFIKNKIDPYDDFKLISVQNEYKTVVKFNKNLNDNYHVNNRIREMNFNSLSEMGVYFEHNGHAITIIPVASTPWYIENTQSFQNLHRPITRLLYLTFTLILFMVAVSIASSWKIIQTSVKEIEGYQIQLVKSNNDLTESLKELKRTQDQLIRRETLAALGELVGGLMHELSTPIGTAITSLSFLDQEVKKYCKQ